MTRHLEVDAELEQPVTVEEDADDENAQRLEQVNGIPEDVCVGGVELPFDECAHAVIDGEPKAKPQIGPLPGVRYIVY